MKKISLLSILLTLAFISVNYAQNTKIKMETTSGDITIMLYDDTPLHKENFIKLVKDNYYDGLLFHRVIKGFMIQGGDPESRNAEKSKHLGMGNPGYTIPAEISMNHIHKKGALAAARTENPQKASSGSQFYIVQGNVYTDMQIDQFERRINKKYTEKQRDDYTTIGGTPHLDNSYTVFGEVIEGLEVIDKIASVQTGVADRPIEDVKIIKMKIIE